MIDGGRANARITWRGMRVATADNAIDTLPASVFIEKSRFPESQQLSTVISEHQHQSEYHRGIESTRTQQNHNTLPHPNRTTEPSSTSGQQLHAIAMFATQPPSSPSTPFRQTGHYTPARPSPLGPRSANIATPPWTMGSAGQPQKSTGSDENAQCSPVSFPSFQIYNDHQQQQSQQQNQQQCQSPTIFNNTSTSSTHSPFFPQQSTLMSPTSPSPSTRPKYADRYANQIANPLKNTTSLARSKTRKMFLNRVKNERDAGRFEARGEQMMMAEYLADKRRWEESMKRDVDGIMEGFEGVVEEEMRTDEADPSALDEYISQEEALEMALRETSMAQGHRQYPVHNEHRVSFSDDEYDDIFMTISDPAPSQDMDMS